MITVFFFSLLANVKYTSNATEPIKYDNYTPHPQADEQMIEPHVFIFITAQNIPQLTFLVLISFRHRKLNQIRLTRS